VKILEALAKLCAIAAGLLLTAITLMTCASLVGRNTTGTTLVGDFELTGVATGAAIALFMPWCQVRRGNIIVDFFTQKLRVRSQRLLDAFYTDTDTWKKQILRQAKEAMVQAVDGLSAHQ
jgi:TRAP-type C4-dicarboxylate transport system permease small subunit